MDKDARCVSALPGPIGLARVCAAAWVVVVSSLLYPIATDSQTTEPAPDGVFVLGDSLSDIGNAAALADYLLGRASEPEHDVGLCNPADIVLFSRDCSEIVYRQSRVSDGPVAVEYLAMHLGLPELVASFHGVPDRAGAGSNYAVAGAKARGSRVSDLSQQVDALLLGNGPMLPDTGLYVVMIGGNDAIDALQASVLPSVTDPGEAAGDATGGSTGEDPATDAAAGESSDEIIAGAVAAIGENVDRLIGSGARLLIVANVPNLAMLPAVRDGAALAGVAEETAVAAAEQIGVQFNTELDARLAQTRQNYPAVLLEQFDLFSVLEELRTMAAASGKNVTDACFDSETYFDSWTAERNFHSECAPVTDDGAPRFEEFFFWDAIHPSSSVHAGIGQGLIEAFARLQPTAQ